MQTKHTKAKDTYYLRHYGKKYIQYTKLYKKQKGECVLCLRKYPVLHWDHRHVKGYKNLSPEDKAVECRGLLCMRCNRFTVGGLEIHKEARQVLIRLVRYFKKYPIKGD